MPSQPKFKKGDIVKYTSTKVKEFLEYRNKLIKDGYTDIGESPTHKLHIYGEPHYNGKDWIYYYDYGHTFTSEGCAIETDLEYFTK